MKMNEFLPVGSVVLLKDAQKALNIIGIMPVSEGADGKAMYFDYIGVTYPEGFSGMENCLVFNHDQIDQILFTGYDTPERRFLLETIQKIQDTVDENVKNSQEKSGN